MPMDEPFSLYVHIPFCRSLCSYCAFNTYAGLDALIPAYVDALRREMALVAQAADAPLASHTLYFGGGTPSLLAARQVEAIIAAARDSVGLRLDAEITLEANPGSLDLARLEALRAAGITRLSLGVQSAHASELKLFGRAHTFAGAAQAFALARRAGFDNISIDLIYGAPHQTRQNWRETLNKTLAWEPDHISLYSLSIEPGTSLHHRAQQGLLPSPDPDLAADMYDDARAWCARAGLRQYEIANWARPGFECAHNKQYWLNRPFLGFGAGAHGAARGLRYWNVKPVKGYVERVVSGAARAFPLSPAADDFEVIGEELAMAETAILGLRLVHEGLSLADFERRFNRPAGAVFGPALAELSRAGLVREEGDRLLLAGRAYLVSNRVFARLLPD